MVENIAWWFLFRYCDDSPSKIKLILVAHFRGPLDRPVLGHLNSLGGLWFTFIISVQSRLINKTVWILFMFVLIYSPIGSIYYLIHYSNLISYHSENICHPGKFHQIIVARCYNFKRLLRIRNRVQGSPWKWYQRAAFHLTFDENLKKKSGFTTEYNITHTIPDDYSDIGTQECASIFHSEYPQKGWSL